MPRAPGASSKPPAERLAVERRRRFWGRDAELTLFRSALMGEGAVFSVLYVHGLGGAGKSSLLREYMAVAAQHGVTAVYLDGRLVDPSPGAFLLALRDACELDGSASPLDHLRVLDRLVLMLDSYDLLAIHACSTEDVDGDPAVRAARDFVRRHGPVRAGEEMLHHRFHAACDVYQAVSPTINLLAMMVTVAPARHPRLAWSFITLREADPWRPVMQYINFQHTDDAAFSVGGHRYAVFAHDWRVETFDAWWEREMEYSLASELNAEAVVGSTAATLAVLSEPEFVAAVRQALRDYARPEALAGNPLLRSRVVMEAAGHEPTVANLQALLHEAVERLKASEP